MPQYIVCLSLRPSVCPSVTFRYRDHIGWNSSNIISRPNSLRPMRGLTPIWASWCNGDTPKIRVEYGWGHAGAQKPAISPKRCNVGPRLLWMTNKKSHARFRLVFGSLPKSTTMDDLERRIQGLPKVCKYGTRYYLRNRWSYGLQIWPVHSQGPSEQKAIKNFGEKGAWVYPGAAQSFKVPPIILGTGKATDFKFGR